MKQAASALVDLRTYSKGRQLFKKRNQKEIAELRDEMLRNDPSLKSIGAFQKALKTLWNDANQEYWEEQSIGEAEDIFEWDKLYVSVRLV